MNLPWIGKGEGEERGRKKGKGREKDGGREGGRNRKKKHVSSCCLHVQCFSLHVDSHKTNIRTHKIIPLRKSQRQIHYLPAGGQQMVYIYTHNIIYIIYTGVCNIIIMFRP